jgi:integrase
LDHVIVGLSNPETATDVFGAKLGSCCYERELKAVEVELWLKNLERAPGTRCKIRNVMSLLFNHARRYDLYDRNPIQWVRQSAKRRTAPDVLTISEVRRLLAELKPSERILVNPGVVGRAHGPAKKRAIRSSVERC